MHIRTVSNQIKPGKIDDFASAWKQYILPRLEEIAGFKGAYLTCDRGNNKIFSVAFWDSKPDVSPSQHATQVARERLTEYTASPANFEVYEVIVEAKSTDHA